MYNFILRSEELSDAKILDYYVGTTHDEGILNDLEAPFPCLLEGSRGVGKSFLFKVLKQRLLSEFSNKQILPVMVTFRNSPFLKTDNESTFYYWMLARITTEILRALKRAGVLTGPTSFLYRGPANSDDEAELERICKQYEDSWRNTADQIDVSKLPTIDDLLQAIEDICESSSLKRIIVNIDEAAHVFIPAQQRQFFTLFRDLRSAYLKCNAAIYPGTTCFGDTFQPMHDAKFLRISRNIQDDNYVASMRDMVTNQIENASIVRNLSQYGANFTLLAYAANGNPRLLFSTLGMVENLKNASTDKIFREFYREKIWSEHSALAEKFPSCKDLIDWGRDFIENNVLPELKAKNDNYISKNQPSTFCFWIHRDAPQMNKEALRLLEYTGIITENASGIRATRNGIGTRYSVNIGCLVALEGTPTTTGTLLIQNNTIKRMSEYGATNPCYEPLSSKSIVQEESTSNQILRDQFDKSIDCLDLTDWQKDKLHSVSIHTIGELACASESTVMEAYYVGEVRARQMQNAAYAALFEYLLG
jgi:hypothetical protein